MTLKQHDEERRGQGSHGHEFAFDQEYYSGAYARDYNIEMDCYRSLAQENELEVGKPAHQLIDDRIGGDVRELLTRNSQLNPNAINVSVRSGTVTLRGVVDSEQCSQMAERAVQSMPGVRAVHNLLRVG